ncbi:MAG: homogentisate 1,2-dioxygenase [Acidimicrobiales bacterium]
MSSFEAPDSASPEGRPLAMYRNQDVTISWSQRGEAQTTPLRNLDGDLLFFVHEGGGELMTDYGPLGYEKGDFVYVPKAVTHQFFPSTPSQMLVIEPATPLDLFDIDAAGRHAPFDPSVLAIPEPCPREESGPGEYVVTYKLRGDYPTATLRHDPFDVVGWKGDLFPFKLAFDDLMPVHSERAHLAPTIGGLFQAEGMVVTNLIPQPSVADLDAEELPSYHRNIDYDEFWLIHRAGGPVDGGGQLIYTPQGFVHGATEELRSMHQAARKSDDRRELAAIGIEAWRALTPTPEYLASIEPSS